MSITIVESGSDQLAVEVGGEFAVTLNGVELYRTADFNFNLADDPIFWAAALDDGAGYGGETAYTLPAGIRDELGILLIAGEVA